MSTQTGDSGPSPLKRIGVHESKTTIKRSGPERTVGPKKGVPCTTDIKTSIVGGTGTVVPASVHEVLDGVARRLETTEITARLLSG